MYPFIHILNINIPSYWVMGMLGIGMAIAFVYWQNRHFHMNKDDILHIFLFAVIGAIIGSKALYILTILPGIIIHFSSITWSAETLTSLLQGGFVFYGGLAGALLCIWRYCTKYKVSLKTTAALMTPAIPLFHTFGRVGCFLAGCCWGIEVPHGVVYTHSYGAPNGVSLLPIQLIEAFCNLLLFCFLLLAVRKMVNKWLVFPLYIVLYSCIRFVLEFFRGDTERGIFFFLSTSQWISLVLVAGTFCWCFFYIKSTSKSSRHI